MLSEIVRGQEVTDSTEFFDEFGNPLRVKRATFTVRDFHRNLITKGAGAQNPVTPEQWSCSFTIPDHCPITDNTYYTLTWTAVSEDNHTQTNTTRFEVVDNLEDYPQEEGQVVFYQDTFEAKLFLPFKVTGLSLRIAKDNANTSADVMFYRNNPDNFAVRRAGKGYVYSVPVLVDATNKTYSNGLDESPVVATGTVNMGNQTQNPNQTTSTTTTNADGTTSTTSMTTTYSTFGNITNPGQITGLSPTAWGLNSMFLYWNYVDSQGNHETVVNRLYVVNGKMIRMMDDVRRQADRIRNRWTIPQLRITDIDLAHFCLKGMDMFNAEPPAANGVWALGNLPEPVYDIVFTAAMTRLCEAQALALGETEFQFSGQAVSLSNAGAGPWQQASSDYERQFKDRASSAKRALIKSGVGASIGGTWGPTALLVGANPYGYGSVGFSPALPFVV